MAQNELLDSLNPVQRKAAETVTGPLLILAGAGSGKTRVLTHRVAHIIELREARPDQILAVTFTNKAAREMEHRVIDLLGQMDSEFHVHSAGYGPNQLWITTFHSACVRMLRQYHDRLGYQRSFSIYDDGDQMSQIKKVLNSMNVDENLLAPKLLKSLINQCKTLGLTPEKAEKSSKVLMDRLGLEAFAMYEKEMRKANAMDFGDLLMKADQLIREFPDVLESYQNKFKFIMVDEYQDTNKIQYEFIKLLSAKHRNLCVVGDEDQSIYSWRGADIQNILSFEKDFPEAVVVKLEENYRSTKTIVEAASHVIKNNEERKDKTLFTSNPQGDKIQLREENNEHDEARFVAHKISSLAKAGDYTFREFAVFYRTNAQSRVLEEQLRLNQIPYRMVGGLRFYERMEIKDAISYLKLIANPTDDVAFKRCFNTPVRGLGKTTLEQLEHKSIESGFSMMEAAMWALDNRLFNAGTTSKLRRFVELIADLQGTQDSMALPEFFGQVLDKSEYIKKLKEDRSPEAQTRVENLESLGNALVEFTKERADATLVEFLEEMALVSDVDELKVEEAAVTLMTLHSSKGLEFPVAFIVGMEENLFPSSRARDGKSDDDDEEERRLAYVGFTRARKLLHLSYARTRKVWGQDQSNPPSRFIAEIPAHLIESSSQVARMPDFLKTFAAKYGSKAQGAQAQDSHTSKDGFESQSFTDDYEAPKTTILRSSNSANSSGLTGGMRVRHPTFGPGKIYETEGSGEMQKVTVMFDNRTLKKFVVKHARLEVIG